MSVCGQRSFFSLPKATAKPNFKRLQDSRQRRQILPSHVALVNPASYVVRAASQELDLMGLRCSDICGRAETRFFVSGDPDRFAQVSRRWLGKLPLVEKVSLSPVELLS